MLSYENINIFIIKALLLEILMSTNISKQTVPNEPLYSPQIYQTLLMNFKSQYSSFVFNIFGVKLFACIVLKWVSGVDEVEPKSGTSTKASHVLDLLALICLS